MKNQDQMAMEIEKCFKFIKAAGTVVRAGHGNRHFVMVPNEHGAPDKFYKYTYLRKVVATLQKFCLFMHNSDEGYFVFAAGGTKVEAARYVLRAVGKVIDLRPKMDKETTDILGQIVDGCKKIKEDEDKRKAEGRVPWTPGAINPPPQEEKAPATPAAVRMLHHLQVAVKDARWLIYFSDGSVYTSELVRRGLLATTMIELVPKGIRDMVTCMEEVVVTSRPPLPTR